MQSASLVLEILGCASSAAAMPAVLRMQRHGVCLNEKYSGDDKSGKQNWIRNR